VFTRLPTRHVASSPPVSSSRSFSSRRIVQLPTVCASESCANNVPKLANLLASYSLSYSSSLTPYHTCRVSSLSHLSCLLAILLVALRLIRYRPRRRYPHRDRTRRVVLYNFPLSLPLRAALTMSRSSPIYSPRLTRYPTRRVYLPSYSSPLTRYCPCCRIDVVLIAPCLILQSRFVSDTRRVMLPTLGTALQAMM